MFCNLLLLLALYTLVVCHGMWENAWQGYVLSGLGSSFYCYVVDLHIYVVLYILYQCCARFMHGHRI